jgi:uncharacterized membrane protein
LEKLFQTLFSYRPVVFQQGEFRFNVTTGSFVATAVVAAVVILAVLTYRRVRVNEGRRRDRVILTTLRVLTLAVVLFCLFRPTLIVRAAVTQQNVVAVLLDDSRSMQIADWNGKPRADFIRQQFGAADSPLRKALGDRFIVRVFRFSATTGRIAEVKDLNFDGAQTRLGVALDGAREELAGLPVSGVVLVSDGADTSEASLQTSLLGMKASKLPVFTVAVGSEKLPRDVQIDRVSTPRTVLKDASLLLDVVVTNTGYAGRTVTVDVEDDGRIIGSQKVQLPSDGSPASVRVRATASEAGPRVFTFKVAPQEGELVTQNNIRESLINVRDERARLLYYEGEPRWEMKFLRRAVADDKNLLVVTLQRTADNKFMRLDGDPDEVVGGFPKTREELFKYRGLILGSVEAAAFSADQLQMIADFVDRRGGGLLMLGGARSFGEGGYGGTPVADALPLAIDPRTRASEPSVLLRMTVAPTRPGAQHAVTQIADTEEKSLARWPQLPAVTSVNAPLQLKPGATLLMTGTDERGRSGIPVLASHQFGRGKGIAFPIQDSYAWQMDASIPVDDQTHERFWRQMLRWVVEGVPDGVEVKTDTERVDPGEAVTIEANVRDKQFVEMNDATVVAQVARPNGATFTVPLQWTGERDGEYRGTFVTSEPGAYDVNVDASRATQPGGSGRTYVRAAAADVEFFDPTMHQAPLRRIADDTGGRFYKADQFINPQQIANIAEDVRYAGRGVTSIEERELWNMPIILIMLFGLVCGEWGYRRAVGLA